MYFTQEDFRKIEQYIKKTAIKDTEFPTASTTIGDEDSIVIVQDGVNKILTIKELIINVSEYVTTEGATYMGVATPTTVPWTDNRHKVWYFAYEAGDYTNFGSAITLDGNELVILRLAIPETGYWVVDRLNLNIKAIDVANNALTVADRALSIAGTFKSDLAEVRTTANTASDLSNRAYTSANEAIDKANKSVKLSDRGIPGGVPILDASGKVPQSQLPLTKTELVDSYESTRTDAAPTAAALNRLYQYHEQDIVNNKNILDAVLDMVSASTELGVAPTSINISSLAQEVKVQVVCNGGWTIPEIPANVTATPSSGTGNSLITFSFPANASQDTEVTGTIKVANSYGKEKTITFRQYPASMIYRYDLTVTPTTLSVQAGSGQGTLTVVSTKTATINGVDQGEPIVVPYTTSKPEGDTWLTVNANAYSYTENVLEASRTSKITLTQTETGGKTIEVPVTQAKATMNTSYAFTIEPANATIEDAGLGGEYPITITSTKTVTVNETITTTDVPYIVSYTGEATAEWVTYNKDTHKVTLLINPNTTDRTGSIKFTQESPMTNIIDVPITQKGAVEEWRYTFEYSPLTMEFGNVAGEKTYSVPKSVKQKFINNVAQGEEIYVSWTAELTGEGFTLDTTANKVTASANTGAQRTGTLTFKRAEVPNEDKTIAITQAAGVVTYVYELTAGIEPPEVSYPGSDETVIVLGVTSKKKKYMNGVFQEDITVPFRTTSNQDWLTIQSGQGTAQESWKIAANNTDSVRTAALTVTQLEDNGKTVNVDVTQVAGTVTYDYTFTLSPTVLNFDSHGGTQSIVVVSNKQKKINGNISGNHIDVAYTSAIAQGSLYTINGNSITSAANNTPGSKTGQAGFTQAETNTVKYVSLQTVEGTVTLIYSFAVSPNPPIGTVEAKPTSPFVITVTDSHYNTYINGVDTGSSSTAGHSFTMNAMNGQIVSVSQSSDRNTYSITFPENTSASERTWVGGITQDGSNKSFDVSVTQAAAAIEEIDEVDVFPLEETWEASNIGTSFKREFTITPERIRYINGTQVSREYIATKACLEFSRGQWTGSEIVSGMGWSPHGAAPYTVWAYPTIRNETGDDWICDIQIADESGITLANATCIQHGSGPGY